MFSLYYSPGVCSLAVHVALIEMEQPFELIEINLNKGKNREPEFLAINPRGQVPVLKEADGTMHREGAAMLLMLAERTNSPLLPTDKTAREPAIEWLFFANASLHPAYAKAFMQHKVLGANAAENPLYAPAIAGIQSLWDELEEVLQTQDYLCGEDITLADILVTVIANWSTNLKQPITFGDATKAFLLRVSGRGAFQAAMKAEGVQYRVVKQA